MSDVPPIGAPEERGAERGRVATWVRQPKTVLGALVVVLTVWFILANTSETRIHFWFVWVTAKLWVAFVVTFAAGLIIGYLLRRRTGGRRREEEEEKEKDRPRQRQS